MAKLSYQLNPVLMGGVITKTASDDVKINLNGRLGVLYVKKSLLLHPDDITENDRIGFYFSDLQLTEQPLDYDYTPLSADTDTEPCLVGGILEEVNDTAVKVRIGRNLGTVAVPRRWVFTDKEPAEQDHVEFYLSRIKRVQDY